MMDLINRKKYIQFAKYMQYTCILSAYFAASSAIAGTYLEYETIFPNPVTGKPVKSLVRSWREGNKLKRESPMRNEMIIVDFEQKKVFGVNDKNKTYWEMPASEYQYIAVQSLPAFGIAVQPDGSIGVPDPLFRVTGEQGEVAGHAAQEYKIAAKNRQTQDMSLWISSDIPLKGADMAWEMKMILGDPAHPSYQKFYQAWEKMPGYPVQTVTTLHTSQGDIIAAETLVTCRSEKIPMQQFLVPKEYQKIDNPMVMLQKAAQKPAPVGLDAPLGQ